LANALVQRCLYDLLHVADFCRSLTEAIITRDVCESSVDDEKDLSVAREAQKVSFSKSSPQRHSPAALRHRTRVRGQQGAGTYEGCEVDVIVHTVCRKADNTSVQTK
jgi:hypothetical protein